MEDFSARCFLSSENSATLSSVGPKVSQIRRVMKHCLDLDFMKRSVFFSRFLFASLLKLLQYDWSSLGNHFSKSPELTT